MPDATSLHHCLKNKQLKLNAFSSKDQQKENLILCIHRKGVANTCIIIDHTPMQLENCCTCCIERRWHILYKPPSIRLATGLLVSNA